jgi:hypothetical protein
MPPSRVIRCALCRVVMSPMSRARIVEGATYHPGCWDRKVRLAAEKSKRLGDPPPPTAPTAPKAIILHLEPHKYSIAVWIGDQDGQQVYSIVHENIREAAVAATLSREAARNVGKRLR